MCTHGLLSLPFNKDRESSTYDLEAPGDHIHCAAQQRAKKLGTKLASFDIDSPERLAPALSAIEKCSVVLVDAHGSRGSLCLGSPETLLDPIDLGLRESALEILVVGSCRQESDRWNRAAPLGCLIIGYTGKLLAGASHGLITHAADLGDLQDIPENHEGAEAMADWVQARSHPASKRAAEWFVARARP
ncbi:hypothetical protein [Brevibacterium casei]|uniref:hypothetical protein n=1 Tax=Brevibacterium casei TaxID=33889 RepID=UPI00223BAA35|nr:hypothetical protein [Brevibacterium casei]MCT1549653.1 hypothetical protein [Brevibacterium casei]MCT1559190.1 hypothetical protein [Brevibacterium casei]MCT2207618.1 hypothetical protein [Brevibacterium casei]